MFGDLVKLENLLAETLRFVDDWLAKHEGEESREAQRMRAYRAKTYALMGVCLAGVRNFRYSRICSKKSLRLADIELVAESNAKSIQEPPGADDQEGTERAADAQEASSESNSSPRGTLAPDGNNQHSQAMRGTTHTSKMLVQTKIDCLLMASEACVQIVDTFREHREQRHVSSERLVRHLVLAERRATKVNSTNPSASGEEAGNNESSDEKNHKQDREDFQGGGGDGSERRKDLEFEEYELHTVNQSHEARVAHAREAYLLAKTLIDPTVRAQTAFNLATSLMDNNMHESAAYYFNQVSVLYS